MMHESNDVVSSEPRLIRTGIPQLLPMTGRAPGLHISSIISSLCVRLGHYPPKEEWSESDITRMQLGCALEDTIALRWTQEYPDRYVQLGGLELDGLHGTPDFVDTWDWAVEEIKLTWMSSRHDPDSEKYWRYWTQVKSYCHILGTRIGRLHVCCINGNYKFDDGGGPQYRVWEREFSEQELAENWALLKSHGEKYKEELEES